MDKDLLEKNYKKINDQLFFIGCRKSKIKKEIYSVYEIYLKLIRFKLHNYIGEAIKVLFVESGDGIKVKDQKTILFIKNDLKKIVNDILPFLTIEQLSIEKDYKNTNRIKNNIVFKSNYDLKEEVHIVNNFETNNINNSTNYCNFYYEDLINENKFGNINMDNCLLDSNYTDNSKYDKNLGFINSSILLNNFDEDKLSINIYQSKDSKYFIPNEFKDIILWIDTLESSLNLYLKDLSIEINNELFKKNIFENFINYDLLNYIFDNHLLFTNPSPFVLTFDSSLTQYINFDEKIGGKFFTKLNLININSSELEFININLSILKNKLMELKSNIYLLIKKENYWSNKLKLNSNIKTTINKL